MVFLLEFDNRRARLAVDGLSFAGFVIAALESTCTTNEGTD